jgi:glutamate N-acetyltransferase/amino-acid N-acetyltransferase
MSNPGAPKELHVAGGFKWSSFTAGIKASGRPDLALAEAPMGASAAAVYTSNRVVAAPITVDRANLKKSNGRVRALLVNSGNANCATGKPGIAAAEACCKALGRVLEVAPEFIFPSSTGIIGVPFPTETVVNALPGAVAERSSGEGALRAFADAILTTDTVPKLASAALHGTHKVSVVGVAKGSGMIHPNLATMLVYVFTDIVATPAQLQSVLDKVVRSTFNCISVDGDTSTNDTVLVMASGQSGVRYTERGVAKKFEAALHAVCASLAEQIIRDGEGASHLIRLNIEQARNYDEALQIAKTIAHSPLVKTAWAGADPNWGRLLSSVGKSGIAVDPSKVQIFMGKHCVCKNGMAHPFDVKAAHEYLKQREYEVRILLGRGKAEVRFLTCDLTTEYVHINADYST